VRGALSLLPIVLALACAAEAPSPARSSPDTVADDRALGEAVRLLGTDARLVFRQADTTLRLVYGDGPEDRGLFSVYASPAGGLFAEVFVRDADRRVVFSRTTADPVRR
jgi:hypothetical protein